MHLGHAARQDQRQIASQPAQGLVPQRRLRSDIPSEAAAPAFVALLASGFSPVYPCHVPARDMRQRPIGTGPLKFVEFKPNESIKLTRNPDYWKPGRRYLDGIEYTVIRSPATEILAFASGNFDRTELSILSIPLFKEIKNQVSQ